MSFSYYKLLFYSLGITLGIYILFYVYRAYVRRARVAVGNIRGFIRLLPLEIPQRGGDFQFRFSVTSELPVKLEFCDDSYNVLFTLADKTFGAGEHVVRMNSDKINSGVYFYKLKTSSQEIIKKLEF